MEKVRESQGKYYVFSLNYYNLWHLKIVKLKRFWDIQVIKFQNFLQPWWRISLKKCEIKAFWKHSAQISKFSSTMVKNVIQNVWNYSIWGIQVKFQNFLLFEQKMSHFCQYCPILSYIFWKNVLYVATTPLLESLYVHTVLFGKSQSECFIKWVFLSAENAISKCYIAPQTP